MIMINQTLTHWKGLTMKNDYRIFDQSDDDESQKPKPDPPIRATSEFVDDEDPELDTQGDEEHEI